MIVQKVTRRSVVSTLAVVPFLSNVAIADDDSVSQPTKILREKKMSTADDLANGMVRIVLENGKGEGSGFHFIKPDVIVSNAHVVAQLISGQSAMSAHAESGQSWSLNLLAYSPQDQFDFAIMRASGQNFDGRRALLPSTKEITGRGLGLLYAGYPHGIDPLLVHSSEVTSPTKDNAFCFSGMVHGGNSGGPVADAGDLSILGIVTKRRFFGDPEMRAVDAEMQQLQGYLASIGGRGHVNIMGVNFVEFASAMSRIASLTNDVIRVNSTTGIGIANTIFPVAEKCREIGLL